MDARQPKDTASTGRSARLWGGVIAVLFLVVALLWLIWGFRWPPTAEVVIDGPEASPPASERY